MPFNKEQYKKWYHNNYKKTDNYYFTKVMGHIKHRSKIKNIKCNLDYKYLMEIFPKNKLCPILGVKLLRGRNIMTPNSPTLDRIDPRKGYLKGNVRWVSAKANAMKQDANDKQLLKFADWILKEFG